MSKQAEPQLVNEEAKRAENIDLFIHRFLEVSGSPTTAVTPGQKLALINLLERNGFTLKDGGYMEIGGEAGWNFHEKLLEETQRHQGLGELKPVTLYESKKTNKIFVTYNIPFSTSQAGVIYISSSLKTPDGWKDVSYGFASLDQPASLVVTKNAEAVVRELHLTRSKTAHLTMREGGSLTIRRIDAETGSLKPFINLEEGAKLSIPNEDPFFMDGKITAKNASFSYTDSDGKLWMVEGVTCKGVTIREALLGYRETSRREEKRVFTPEIFERTFSFNAKAEQWSREAIRKRLPEEVKSVKTTNGREYNGLHRIGGGKYSTLYSGYDKENNLVALKVAGDLDKNERLDEEEQRQFDEEPVTLRFLENAQEKLGLAIDGCILTPLLLGTGETTTGRKFFTMTLADGAPLDEVLRGYSLKIEDALRIGGQFARVLEALHDIGQTYHDFQPKNIFWDPHEKRIIVVDFNLLKEKNGQTVNTDIQSAGRLLYRMITGKSIDDEVSLTDQIHEVPAIGNLRDTIQRSLEGGYGSAKEFRIALEQLSRDNETEIRRYDEQLVAGGVKRREPVLHPPVRKRLN